MQEYIEKAKEKLVALFGKNERVLLGAKCRKLTGLSHNGSRVHDYLDQWNLAVSELQKLGSCRCRKNNHRCQEWHMVLFRGR